ncbi:hypothetical protein ACP70R_015606 [Stipagrostis hirtigluma subsp. patula]
MANCARLSSPLPHPLRQAFRRPILRACPAARRQTSRPHRGRHLRLSPVAIPASSSTSAPICLHPPPQHPNSQAPLGRRKNAAVVSSRCSSGAKQCLRYRWPTVPIVALATQRRGEQCRAVEADRASMRPMCYGALRLRAGQPPCRARHRGTEVVNSLAATAPRNSRRRLARLP